MKWFLKCLKKYADFSGRARRKEYWMFVLLSMIFVLLLFWVLPIVFHLFGYYFYRSDHALPFIFLAVIIFYMLTIFPNLAVTVRRLHDVGKSGSMFFISFIPVVGAIWLFVLLIRKGQTGENEYGLDPKTSSEAFHVSNTRYPKTQRLMNAADIFFNAVIFLLSVVLLCVLTYIIYLIDDNDVLPLSLLAIIFVLPILIIVGTQFKKEK